MFSLLLESLSSPKELTWADLDRIASKIGFGVNTVNILLAFVWSIRTLRNARIARQNTEYSALLTRNADSLKRYEDNEFRKNALIIFTSDQVAQGSRSVAAEKYEDHYWGARFLLLDMLSLAFQACCFRAEDLASNTITQGGRR